MPTVTNATCNHCGCLCDDIDITHDGERIVEAANACPLGESWFVNQTSLRDRPEATIDGRPASIEAAIAKAAEILDAAHLPLVYGMGTVTCEAQREAAGLAEAVGAVLDSHTSVTHGPTKLAGQLMGKVTCTLGEVKNRADLVVYWGSNPVETHPRHLSRYTTMPLGKFMPKGRRGRTVVVVDVRETPTSHEADLFLKIHPGCDFELLTVLHAAIKEKHVPPGAAASCGLDAQKLDEVVRLLKRTRFGVFFFGGGLTSTRGKHLNVAALLTLTRELNAFAKFATMPMRTHGNEAGADNVLSWIAGFPFAVDLSRGMPRYNPGEFTAIDLLARRDCDAALIVGADPAASMPPRALEHLTRIPTIVLDPRSTATTRLARVHITTAATGIGAAGTAYRMDKVPLPLRLAMASPYPTDEAVLRRIRTAIGS